MNSNKQLDFLQQMANPQTPNSFLSSLPKLHMEEINQFESTFGKSQQQQQQIATQEVSPANEVMPSMDAQAAAAAAANSQQQQQQMMDSIAAAFNHSSNQQMMLPMTPDSYSIQTPPMPSDFSPQSQLGNMNMGQWNPKRRPSFLADQSLGGGVSSDYGIPSLQSFQMQKPDLPDFSNTTDLQSQPKPRARSQSMANIHTFNRPDSSEDVQRLGFLERNRKAAMKCRQKKKNYLIGLEQKVESLAKENKRLHEELAQFKAMAGLSN